MGTALGTAHLIAAFEEEQKVNCGELENDDYFIDFKLFSPIRNHSRSFSN